MLWYSLIFVAACPAVQNVASRAPPPFAATRFLLDDLPAAPPPSDAAAEIPTIELGIAGLDPLPAATTPGRLVFALPVTAAREEGERVPRCELVAADGTALPLQREGAKGVVARIVPAVQSIECAKSGAFRGLPRRRISGGDRPDVFGPSVTGSLDLPLRFDRFGGPATLTWTGVLVDPGAPSERPRVEVRCGESLLGVLSIDGRGDAPGRIELPPATGRQELLLRVVWAATGRKGMSLVFDRLDLEERAGTEARDRLVLRMERPPEGLKLRYAAALPEPVAPFTISGGAATLAAFTLAGDAALVASVPQALHGTIDGRPIADAELSRGVVPLHFAAGAPHRFRIEPAPGGPDLAGAFWLEQPAALTQRSVSLGRGEVAGRDVAPGRVAAVECGDDTRRALLLACDGEASLRFDAIPGDVLEFALALKDLAPPQTPSAPASVDLELERADGTARRLASVDLAEPDRWHEGRVELGDAAGACKLNVRARSTGAHPALARLQRIALAEPTRIRAAATKPPDVLIYLIDTLRADHCSTFGYARATTPRLDELARDGVAFEQAYSQAPWTRPSVASLFTGLLPDGHGAGRRTGLSDSATTMAELLRASGRTTAAFISNSKVHAGGLGFERGFCRFVATDAPDRMVRSDAVGAAVLPWLQELRARPFFVYVHTLDPHNPYDPPPATRGRFERDYHGFVTPRTLTDELDARAPLAPDDLAEAVALYDEEIAFNDAQLGVVLDELRRLGLYDETLIVVVADHGEEFGEHGRFGHGGRLWQELLRVPLVIKFPKSLGRPPARIAEPVRVVDVLPTILGALQVRPGRARFEGVDLGPRLGGAPVEGLPVIAEEEPALRTLIEAPWKLIREGGAPDRLFDLAQDPHETKDLAAAQPERAQRLLNALDALNAEYLRQGFAPGRGRPFLPQQSDLKALRKLGYADR
jgi:arylsulfatase A-like enzyme